MIPTLTLVRVSSNGTNSSFAKLGQLITLYINSSIAIRKPSVSLFGTTVEPSSVDGAHNKSWISVLQVTEATSEDFVSLSVAFASVAGVVGTTVTTTTDESSVLVGKFDIFLIFIMLRGVRVSSKKTNQNKNQHKSKQIKTNINTNINKI